MGQSVLGGSRKGKREISGSLRVTGSHVGWPRIKEKIRSGVFIVRRGGLKIHYLKLFNIMKAEGGGWCPEQRSRSTELSGREAARLCNDGFLALNHYLYGRCGVFLEDVGSANRKPETSARKLLYTVHKERGSMES